MADKRPIIVIDRETGEAFEEAILGEGWLRWAYHDKRSGLLRRALFSTPFFSRLIGRWYDSRLSKRKIAKVIRDLGIDVSEFADPADSYRSFNDFFTRQLKPNVRPYSKDPNDIIAPADGRTLVFPTITEDTFAPVKGRPFSIRKMLPDHAETFINGALAVIRLSPADYHRYHFPCAGKIIEHKDIKGLFHSVNPIALERASDVFGDNKRAYTIIDTEVAGRLCYMEIGAFGVGSIVNTCCSGAVEKMQEKGYFKFGGSTVVLLFEAGKIEFCEDLVENSAQGKETLVKVGQPLAKVV